ncbi:uncharacterized protein LOC143886024 [Tasmannia lanceolata]|uniref:uncharacterized protein LOC143886024 n=1 Tax=Tasmannia lanceolata TaxID=3420 RepID=UPI004063CA5C
MKSNKIQKSKSTNRFFENKTYANHGVLDPIQKELIEHIRDAKTPKEAWEALSSLFSRANDARLQFLENEIGSLTQGNLSVSDYFMKAKNFCNEISQLDEVSKISESRMPRMIIRGLRPEFTGFITAIRGWPTQPSLLELENLLINQEMLARQMAGLSVKENEEALAVNSKRKWKKNKKPKDGYKRDHRANNNDNSQEKCVFYCYGCGKPGHNRRNCRAGIETDEGNSIVESKDFQ